MNYVTKIAQWLFIYRTFNVAKAVIKDNKYVRNKKDHLINLNENGKLQEVSYIVCR